MSDMKILADEIAVTPSEAQAKTNAALIVSLKRNPNVRVLMEKNNIPLSCIDSHPWRLRDWIYGLQKCSGCKGLWECRQKNPGCLNDLKYDGVLQYEQRPCRYKRQKEGSLAHKQNYLICDLSEEQLVVDFNRINVEEEDADYQKLLTAVMHACQDGEGLYIYGPMGTGKTYLAACAANYHTRKGVRTAFVHYPSFIQRMSASVAEGEYRTELARLKFAGFAVLDDIGAEAITEWNRDQLLLPVLNYRYEHHLCTWFTSNEDLKSLAKHFRYTSRGKEEELKAGRIIERIKVLGKAYELNGPDRRLDA